MFPIPSYPEIANSHLMFSHQETIDTHLMDRFFPLRVPPYPLFTKRVCRNVILRR
jgi:hypothetical protein